MKYCTNHSDRPVLAKGLCGSCYQRQWRKTSNVNYFKQAKLHNPRKAKARELRNKYRLPIETYEKMVEAQLGCCAICEKPVEVLHVDHRQGTHIVRGLLCGTCNRGLGMFYDNSQWLENAAQYLKKNEKST